MSTETQVEWLFNWFLKDSVSCTSLHSVCRIGNSGMVFTRDFSMALLVVHHRDGKISEEATVKWAQACSLLLSVDVTLISALIIVRDFNIFFYLQFLNPTYCTKCTSSMSMFYLQISRLILHSFYFTHTWYTLRHRSSRNLVASPPQQRWVPLAWTKFIFEIILPCAPPVGHGEDCGQV